MIIVYNPTAGRRRIAPLWQVIDVLAAHGLQPEIARTRGPGDARALAREAARAGARLVVAAGGDGTIAEVAAGLAQAASGQDASGRDGTLQERAGQAATARDGAGPDVGVGGAALGIIPLGTANVLAHELGLPGDPAALAACLAFGRTRPLWPGVAEGPGGVRLFVQMIGVGLDAQVVHRVSPRLKRAIGRHAYVLQTLREVGRYGYAPIRVRLDGRETEAASVVVSKGRFYGGPYLLAPGASVSAPGFTVALFRGQGAFAALGYGAALALDRLSRSGGLDLVPARRIEVLGDGGDPAQADGDPAGRTPIAIRDAERPLAVVTPELAPVT